MSNKKKTYVPLDIRDWPAENGPVRLGSIIADPSSPHKPINSIPFVLPEEVYEKEEPGWKDVRNKNNNGFAGIFARAFGLIDVAELSAGWGIKEVESFEAEKMVKKFFVADDDYIAGRMEDEKVQQFLKAHRKRVFMITGLMIAYKPTASTVEGKSIDLAAKAGFDAGGAQVGPNVKWSGSKGSNTSYKGGSDVVYAMQLVSISYKVVEENISLVVKEHNKGAWHNAEEGRGKDQAKEELVEVVKFLRAEEVTGEDLFMEAKEAFDEVEKEICDYIVIKKD